MTTIKIFIYIDKLRVSVIIIVRFDINSIRALSLVERENHLKCQPCQYVFRISVTY